MFRGFRLPDWALLLTLGPLWAMFFGLHLLAIADQQSARPDFFVERAASAAEYPVVLGHVVEADRTSSIEIGDRVLRVGDVSMQGKGEFDVVAAAILQKDEALRVAVEVERSGERRTEAITLTDRRVPWSSVPLMLGLAALALVVLLRAPGSNDSRLAFAAFSSFSLFVGTVYIGVDLPLGLSVWARPLSGVVAIALMGVWVTRFPPSLHPAERFTAAWPVGLALLWLGARLNFALGGPGLQWNSELYLAVDATIAVSLLYIGSRNYQRVDPAGRRQVKWILYGAYLAAAPLAALSALGALTTAGFAMFHPIAVLMAVAFPLGVLVAIVRYSLFDIDRIIGSTTSYSILGVLFLAAAFVMVPRLAEAASGTIGLDASTGRLAMSLGFAAAVVPIHRRLRPQIDRLVFKERYALEHGVAELLPTLAACLDAKELTERAGAGLHHLLHPEACVVYADVDHSYVPVFAEGATVPPAFEAASPLIGTLLGRRKPLAFGEAGRRPDETPLSPFDRAALETLQAEVVVPVRQGDSLAAFLCLGPKRSGDIYTSTDLSLLSAVAETVSQRLQAFDQEAVTREAQAMQESLRRYVPGAVAEQLSSRGELDAGEREVSVLFVDIRGYTGFAESRRAEEIFSTVNLYTETVSKIVQKHAGSVVEFNGDGMMVVFGAPRELAHKERAAVEAGREIVAAVGALPVENASGVREKLAVGVGIATGDAFVGNIQAVDRMIWSAIGNTTNLAARLQALTRDLEAWLVIDVTTWERAESVAANFEQRCQLPIRGRRETKDVYMLPMRSAS